LFLACAKVGRGRRPRSTGDCPLRKLSWVLGQIVPPGSSVVSGRARSWRAPVVTGRPARAQPYAAVLDADDEELPRHPPRRADPADHLWTMSRRCWNCSPPRSPAGRAASCSPIAASSRQNLVLAAMLRDRRLWRRLSGLGPDVPHRSVAQALRPCLHPGWPDRDQSPRVEAAGGMPGRGRPNGCTSALSVSHRPSARSWSTNGHGPVSTCPACARCPASRPRPGPRGVVRDDLV